jgi:hypothetical protein
MAGKNCEYCGAVLSDEAKFCAKCGATLSNEPRKTSVVSDTAGFVGTTIGKIGKNVPIVGKRHEKQHEAPPPSRQPGAASDAFNGNQVLLEAKGRNGQLQLLPTKVRIIRKGAWALALQGVQGDKEIYLDQISSIQFKKAGLAVGYMRFVFLGGRETKTGIRDTMKDENTVAFVHKHEAEFEAIKRAIEEKMHEARTSRVQQPLQQAAPADIPAQIKKLAELKNQGILTEQEFQQKKEDLLAKM